MKMKKETLEEAAENYSKLKVNKDGLMSDKQIKDFVAGAKWLSENMSIHILDVENTYVHIEDGVIIVEKNDKTKISYSEDEVRELIIKALTHNNYNLCGSLVTRDGEIRTANLGVWFEENKKK
jgi:hypothetical protein